jgi:hypothetical protein
MALIAWLIVGMAIATVAAVMMTRDFDKPTQLRHRRGKWANSSSGGYEWQADPRDTAEPTKVTK